MCNSMSPIPILSLCMSPVHILVNKISISSTMFYCMSPRMFNIHIHTTIVTSSCATLCHQFLYCHFLCHQFVSWSIRCQQVRRCSTLCHQGCSTFILTIRTIVTSSLATLCHQFLYCHFVCHQFVSWSISLWFVNGNITIIYQVHVTTWIL